MNGRVAKKMRREGKRTYKPAPAISPKLKEGPDNFTFDKELYRKRREKGLRGQIQPAVVIQRVLNKDGELEEIIPISGKRPPKSARFAAPFTKMPLGGQRKATVDVPMNAAAAVARGSSRGE